MLKFQKEIKKEENMFKFLLMSCVCGISLLAMAEEQIYVCGQNAVCEDLYHAKIYDAKTGEAVSGIIRKYDENGNLMFEGGIKNNKWDGLWKFYNPDVEGRFQDGDPVGPWKFYFKSTNGNNALEENNYIKCSRPFVEDPHIIHGIKISGCPDGIQRKYWNGQLVKEGSWKDGDKDGLFKNYYTNGNLQMEKLYQNGKIKYSKYYYENGNLLSEEKIELSKTYYKSYYKNGNLQDETTRQDGIIKHHKYYYENGNLQSEMVHKSEKDDGFSKTYYENGNLKSEDKEGLFKTYYENGNLKSEEKVMSYKDGKPVGFMKIYDKNGNLILKSEATDKDDYAATLLFYYEDGSLMAELSTTGDTHTAYTYDKSGNKKEMTKEEFKKLDEELKKYYEEELKKHYRE